MAMTVGIRAMAALILVSGGLCAGATAQNAGTDGKPLTVERIYSQPSLSGRLLSGMTWAPDGASVSYLETKGYGKEARKDFWFAAAATSEKKLLLSAEKLESVLPEDKSKPTQATGLGRRAPAEYRWAPNGTAILFVG